RLQRGRDAHGRAVFHPGGSLDPGGGRRSRRRAHLAVLLPRWDGYSRALPLRLDPAFPPKAVPGAAPPQTEGQAALAQGQWLRAERDAAGRRAQELLVRGDGHYDTVDLWTQLP